MKYIELFRIYISLPRLHYPSLIICIVYNSEALFDVSYPIDSRFSLLGSIHPLYQDLYRYASVTGSRATCCWCEEAESRGEDGELGIAARKANGQSEMLVC